MAAILGLVAGQPGATVAHASLINQPVPANAYIQFLGLDWAWASPVAADGSFPGETYTGVDLAYQSAFGWRLPTAAELANAPSAWQFVFPGANVPLHHVDPLSHASFDFAMTLNGDAALAAPYFTDRWTNGDWCNAPGSSCVVFDTPSEVPWWGQPGAPDFAESLVVRDDLTAVPTPAPATLPLLATGLGLMGLFAWRRQRQHQSHGGAG